MCQNGNHRQRNSPEIWYMACQQARQLAVASRCLPTSTRDELSRNFSINIEDKYLNNIYYYNYKFWGLWSLQGLWVSSASFYPQIVTRLSTQRLPMQTYVKQNTHNLYEQFVELYIIGCSYWNSIDIAIH